MVLSCTAFIWMSTNSQDIFSWSLSSLGTRDIVLTMYFFFASWHYSSPSTPKKRSVPKGLLFMPEVTHDEFLKGCASRGLGALSQGVTQEALVGSELPGPAHKTQALRELQLLPRNRCCCFFPMWSTFVWACSIPAIFMADSLAM